MSDEEDLTQTQPPASPSPPPSPSSVPSDLCACLSYFHARFPFAHPVRDTPAVVLMSQLGSILQDETDIEREINELRLSNTIRVFELSAIGRGQRAVCWTEEYKRNIRTLAREEWGIIVQDNADAQVKAEADARIKGEDGRHSSSIVRKRPRVKQEDEENKVKKEKQQGQIDKQNTTAVPAPAPAPVPASSSSPPISSSELLECGVLLGRLLAGLDRHSEPFIRKSRLLELVYYDTQNEEEYPRPPPRTTFRVLTPDLVIRFLTRCGLLTSRDFEVYWLMFPRHGQLIREILDARQEIYSIIRRKKYKEMPLKDLERLVRLKSSERGVRFHLSEMRGSGLLKVRDTTIGPIVSITKGI